MDTFEWNKSKEDLLKEMCLALSDVFEETDYTIVRVEIKDRHLLFPYRVA